MWKGVCAAIGLPGWSESIYSALLTSLRRLYHFPVHGSGTGAFILNGQLLCWRPVLRLLESAPTMQKAGSTWEFTFPWGAALNPWLRGTAPSPLIGTTLRSDLDLGRSCYDADSNSDSPVWSGGSAIPTSSRVVADVTGLGVPWVYTVLGTSLWDYVASFSGTLLGCLPWLGHLPGLNSLLAISGNTF